MADTDILNVKHQGCCDISVVILFLLHNSVLIGDAYLQKLFLMDLSVKLAIMISTFIFKFMLVCTFIDPHGFTYLIIIICFTLSTVTLQ